MIEALIRSMLGPFEPLLDFMQRKPGIITLFLIILIIIYVAGRLQLRVIEQKTRTMVLEFSQNILIEKPHITSSGLYKRIYPQWSETIAKWGLFIPAKHDFWPVRITPENVVHKFEFSPEWIAEELKKNKVALDEFNNN